MNGEDKPLDEAFFARETTVVARDLLDKVLVREIDGQKLWGRLVEVEAYLGPQDIAAHSKGGRRTPRTEVMFGEPGRAYVYHIRAHWKEDGQDVDEAREATVYAGSKVGIDFTKRPREKVPPPQPKAPPQPPQPKAGV